MEKGKSNRDYFNACELAAKEIPLFYWTGKQGHEFEFLVHSNGKLYPIDVKKKNGGLGSLQEFRTLNGNCMAIKISSNNFGYNTERNILTIPRYAAFLLAEDLREGRMRD